MSAGKKLRELKPRIVDINSPGIANPRFKRVTTQVPAKIVSNTKHNMELLDLYSKGALKDEDFGKVCGTCINYYPDPNLGSHHGRCRAYGYKRVHEELAADDRYNYMEPDGQVYFPFWPSCPMYTPRQRLSRR